MTTSFRVFGGVGAAEDGAPIELGHARQRSVLAILLIEAGRPVPVETLVARLWGARPPQRAIGAVYNYVSRLRATLAPAGVVLRRGTGGYRLEIDPLAVDLHRFTELVTRARSAAGDEVALELFDEALRLWQGELFAPLDNAWLAGIRADGQRQRFAAELDRNDVALRLGRHAEMLAGLAGAVERHPFDERLAAQQMLALYRSGRSADALARFRLVRDRLADELGTEPGPALQELHRRILRADPELTTPGPGGRPVPRQLPAAPRLFSGRAAELERLDRLLPEEGREQSTVLITAVSGTAGIGKTALGLYWAHRVAGRFPDGQLYVNLRGFDRQAAPMTTGEAVIGFLNALQVPPGRVPPGLDAQIALYRSLLAGKRMLVVLDNARDSEHVRSLLPGAPGCLALITSRDQMVGLMAAEGAQVVGLGLLSGDESRELLAARIGPSRVSAEPVAVGEIVDSCARLPLALSIVAARAATHPGFPLEALAVELRAARDRLDAFIGDGSAADLRSVLSWSYQALSPRAAGLLRLLGLHPGPDLDTGAAAALAGTGVRAELAELTRVNLLTEHLPGRFVLHDLLRLYARERALAEDPAETRRAAERRMLDYYLHSAYAAGVRLVPFRDPIDLVPLSPEVVVPARAADPPAAMSWFGAEAPVLIRVTGQAARDGFGTHAWQLVWALTYALDRMSHWTDLAAISELVLEEGPGLVHALEGLARAEVGLGRLDEAERALDRMLTAYRESGDLRGQARVHEGFQLLRFRQNRLPEALAHAERGLGLLTISGPPDSMAITLSNMAFIHLMSGDPQGCIRYCLRALDLHDLLESPAFLANAWDALGDAYQVLGRRREAIGAWTSAAELYRQSGEGRRLAKLLLVVGDEYRSAGELARARAAWSEAFTLLTGLPDGDPGAARERLAGLPVA